MKTINLLSYKIRLSLVLLFLVRIATAQSPWSDPNTWLSGKIPVAGEKVVIPQGKHIVLDVSPPALDGLEIEGILSFDPLKNLNLTTKYIAVFGTFQIGTETDPYKKKAVITLTGSDRKLNVHNCGNNFIGVFPGGTLDIHGWRRDALSWTQLNVNANVGDNKIILKDAVNWRAGDKIAIAPSGFDPFESEEVTITGISTDGKEVTFTPALKYRHWGTLQQYGGRTLDERAEVGLLTRDIVIQGLAETSTQALPFGGHMIFLHSSTVRIEGAELTRMGQRKEQGRYPIHWHHAHDASQEYARNNSLHHCFHRGVVIHQTSNALVENNVVFDTWSHTMIPSEDGNEINNQYINNLVILVRRLEGSQYAFGIIDDDGDFNSTQAEDRPGAFWLRNPDNILIGNHVAGIEKGQGYFYDFTGPVSGGGNGATTFKNNVAHTISSFRGGNLRYPPSSVSNGIFIADVSENTITFDNFTAYKIELVGVWIEIDPQRLTNSIVADCNTAVQTFRSRVENCVLVGQSANTIGGDIPIPDNQVGAAIFLQEHHGGIKTPKVTNTQIIDWDKIPPRYDDDYNLWLKFPAVFVGKENTIGLSNVFKGLTLVNTSRAVGMKIEGTPDPEDFILGYLNDVDGSLSGSGKPSTIWPKDATKRPQSGCVYKDDWKAWLCGMQNQPPQVTITAPADSSVIAVGENVTINATALDLDGKIQKVEFYHGLNKLGEDLTVPYSHTWFNIPAGEYSIHAFAYDAQGTQFSSNIVYLKVDGFDGGLFSNIIAKNSIIYKRAMLSPGEYPYVDARGGLNPAFSYIPDFLKLKSEYIQTGKKDDAERTLDFLTFDLTRDATVFIAYDNKATNIPQWMTDGQWMLTPDSVVVKQSTGSSSYSYRLYKKMLKKGAYILGGNSAAPSENAFNNYFVIGLPMSATSVSSFKQQDQDLRIYPNPASAYVTLVLPDLSIGENARIEICDIAGKVVLSQDINKPNASGQIQISTTGLSNGIYFLNLISPGKTWMRKLAIVKNSD